MEDPEAEPEALGDHGGEPRTRLRSKTPVEGSSGPIRNRTQRRVAPYESQAPKAEDEGYDTDQDLFTGDSIEGVTFVDEKEAFLQRMEIEFDAVYTTTTTKKRDSKEVTWIRSRKRCSEKP